jgi:TnpA family transposase
MLVMLKSFQRLGYFPHPELVPMAVVQHLRSVLKLPSRVSAIPSSTSLYRYQETIREYLKIKPYTKHALGVAAAAISKAAAVMDYPADLINVAIEELVKERYELPAFSTLDRLAHNVRAITNTRLFQKVSAGLSEAERVYLDQLLLPTTSEAQATLNLLKSPPKSSTLSHMQELLIKFERLISFGDAKRLLSSIAPAKVKTLAAQAKVLDIAEFRDINLAKRCTLLLCLLYQAQVKTRDALVDMFLKRMKTIHNHAKDKLVELRERYRTQAEDLLGVLAEILRVSDESDDHARLGAQVHTVLQSHGGAKNLLEQYEEISAYNGDNYFPLLWRFYSHYRKPLFSLIRSLDIRSTSQDLSLLEALKFVLEHEHRRRRWLPVDQIDLSFISEQWRRLVVIRQDETEVLVRQQLEICIFTYLAADLKTGDACVIGSENYADFGEQLLSWAECEPQLEQFCVELGISADPEAFIEQLQEQLTHIATEVDQICKDGTQVTINQEGEPVLKRIPALSKPPGADELEAAIYQKLPERSILDILVNVEHWLNWTRHFGPESGSEPKLNDPIERYILAVFGLGCNLGPNQTARHTKGKVTSHQLSYIHRRHINVKKLQAAMTDIINAYNQLNLPKLWGTGKRAAADGCKFETYENNLFSEYHIRYGGYGGIAYHHVSDTYIALFTHFITCGVWEGVYILDGLFKNVSDIQPDTLHADTQGQSTPVFGLAYLLGINLMPRIRNWKDYSFLRPRHESVYEYIDPLFKGVVDWKLIRTHWPDLMRVALSIKAGKLIPSAILRKLGSASRKNKLYQAFRELGQVVRTIFLLQYISDQGLRQQITACTNIVEGFNQFLSWLFFGKDGVITENDPEEQEKRLKYLDVVACAVTFQNAVDISWATQTLSAEGYKVDQEALKFLSPYIVRHLKRFGDYVVDLGNVPQPFESAIKLPIENAEAQTG